MATMDAALFDGRGKMELHHLPTPEVGPDDALVRVEVCGICGSDLKGYKDRDEPESLPAGHEVAGEIVEVGERVSGARVGERVSIDMVGQGLACFDCWYCRTGQYRWCERRATDPGGGFAGYLVRRAAGCYPLPDGLSWREGAMADPLAVSVHAVRRARMSPGETVVVLGAGTIASPPSLRRELWARVRSTPPPGTRTRPRWLSASARTTCFRPKVMRWETRSTS